MKSYLNLLRATDNKPFIIALSALALICVYIYQGMPSFFREHIASLILTDAEPLIIDFTGRLYQCVAVFILFFFVPALIVKVGLKKELNDFGLQPGDARFGMKFILIALAVAVPFIWFSSFQKEFQSEYPMPLIARHSNEYLFYWELIYFFYYIGWEFMFRGFMLFGLKDAVGAGWAILLQTIPSTLNHFGKPEGEMFAAIPAGLAFGALALRTRSLLYPFVLHYLIGMLNDLFCVMNG